MGVQRVVIVGAGLGGLRTVEFLRAAGFSGQITLVGDERHEPYDRPPLSKQILAGQWPEERAALHRAYRGIWAGAR
jgi:NADPH-dependent 2,4-dienoyl-CoA reductase/sulfur reductase-like enzyme